MLMANLRVAGWPEQRVRVRDISAGGPKVTAELKPEAGTPVQVELPGLGWVAGEVAWTNERGFGVRFAHGVDALAARQPVTGDFTVPRVAPVVLRRVA